MKLLANIFVSRVVPCRYAKGKPRRRPLTYVPWRSQEVVDNLNETLSLPYEQAQPTSVVMRASETSPTKHTWADACKIYTMPDSVRKQYFSLGGFSKELQTLCDIFNENGILIRKPGIEVIDYMKRADYSKLPVKYLLYGVPGVGKQTILLYILHYAAENNFILMHLPDAYYLHKSRDKEANPAETKENMIDLPLDGALTLKRFQLQNQLLIEKSELKTTKEYQWSLRESLPAGSPLMSLVHHGINRIKYACDAIEILVDELKLAATAGKCKVVVAIDGVNSFYVDKTNVKVNGEYVPTEHISIIQSFRSFFKPDWCNGAVVTTACEESTNPELRCGNIMPLSLLRRTAFEELDPFIPLYVSELNELEFDNLLNYYEDRRWLQKYGGREEIAFLTSRNPEKIRNYCAPL